MRLRVRPGRYRVAVTRDRRRRQPLAGAARWPSGGHDEGGAPDLRSPRPWLAAPAAAAEQRTLELLSTACPCLGRGLHRAGRRLRRRLARVRRRRTRRSSAADTDAQPDIYLRTGGRLSCPLTDNALGSDADEDEPQLHSITADGSVASFTSNERLAATDTDNALDVYTRSAGGALVHVSDDGNGDRRPRGRVPGRHVGRRCERRVHDQRVVGRHGHRHRDRRLPAHGGRRPDPCQRRSDRPRRQQLRPELRRFGRPRARVLPHHRAPGGHRHGQQRRRVRARAGRPQPRQRRPARNRSRAARAPRARLARRHMGLPVHARAAHEQRHGHHRGRLRAPVERDRQAPHREHHSARRAAQRPLRRAPRRTGRASGSRRRSAWRPQTRTRTSTATCGWSPASSST